jgi:tetratricopeptide (TPR) repeat protein
VVLLAVGAFALVSHKDAKLRGLGGAGGGGNSPHIIRNDADYWHENERAMELAQQPLLHFGDGETLEPNERADLADAAKIYDSLFDYKPIQPHPRFVGGQISEALGDHDGAIKKLTTFITSVSTAPPSDVLKINVADSHWVISDALSEEGKWQDALDQVNISLQAYPGICQYLATRAYIEWNMGRHDLAKQDLTDSLKADPTNARALKLKKEWKLK